jgi:DNA-binding transcriptional ArsR family regulator
MTTKQLATRLDGTPGAIGHHLRVLERAGLARIVALRLTKGIVAKYYARTARLFLLNASHESAAACWRLA